MYEAIDFIRLRKREYFLCRLNYRRHKFEKETKLTKILEALLLYKHKKAVVLIRLERGVNNIILIK